MKSTIDNHDLERWLSGGRRNLPPELMEIDALLADALVPAIFISKIPFGQTDGAHGCWLGGQPRLPFHIDWPWVVRDDEPFYPMHFIAQFDLAQLPTSFAQTGLPERGTLFFFASYVEDVELGNSSVIYVEESVSETPLRVPPRMSDDLENANEMLWWPSNPVSSFEHCPVELSEYQAVDPNALIAENGKMDDAAYDVAARALAIQCGMLQPIDTLPRSFSARIFNWFRGRKAPRLRAHKTMHRLLSADTGYATAGRPDPSVVRLLTIDHDPDWGFEYACGSLAFFMTVENLSERRFSSAFAFQE